MEQWFFPAYAVMSLIALIVYGIDKRRAKRRRFRIHESCLLSLGFFGGAIGALAGMVLFRHKTRHWYFWMVNFLGLVWQTLLVLYLL